jgi:hypothetical protein
LQAPVCHERGVRLRTLPPSPLSESSMKRTPREAARPPPGFTRPPDDGLSRSTGHSNPRMRHMGGKEALVPSLAVLPPPWCQSPPPPHNSNQRATVVLPSLPSSLPSSKRLPRPLGSLDDVLSPFLSPFLGLGLGLSSSSSSSSLATRRAALPRNIVRHVRHTSPSHRYSPNPTAAQGAAAIP